MCGIIGYVGRRNAQEVLVQGLRRLEYRGYDSAGIAIQTLGKIRRIRSVGKIEELQKLLQNQYFQGTSGIAHTRWSTHGKVTVDNAHPHSCCRGKIMIVHNGIIENYRELRNKLQHHTFTSETDSEILAHLIEEKYTGDLRKSVVNAIADLRGTYGIVVMHSDHPDMLITARLGSPIALGIGEGEYYVASDSTPMLAHTKRIMYLDDHELAEITVNGIAPFTRSDRTIEKSVEEIEWNDQLAEKSGYPYYLEKEIHEQPIVYLDAIRGRAKPEYGTAKMGGISMTTAEMRAIRRIIFIACGTASYAAMIGKYAFEKLAYIPSEVHIASEFRYNNPVIDEHTLVFAISQSGETADTLAALREAKAKGALVKGVVNVVGSTIARESNGGSYIHAGPELSVASTKAYTNMVATLLLYALKFGRQRHVSEEDGKDLLHQMAIVPIHMQKILQQSLSIAGIVENYKSYKNFLFLGRGINYPVALEGALKLKEISYIHAEAQPAGEMKHGTNALLGPDFPIFAIVPKNRLYEKMRTTIEEVRARSSPVIAVATEGDEAIKDLVDDVIYVPSTTELLEPLLHTIPLQLFAYHMAVTLGNDVDRPKNLAKSVVVE